MSPFTEVRHDAAVGRNAVAVMMGFKGLNQDDVDVAMECEHGVAVAIVGVYGELAHAISIYFTFRLNDHI